VPRQVRPAALSEDEEVHPMRGGLATTLTITSLACAAWIAAGAALAGLPQLGARPAAGGAPVHRVADQGISIVRMPPRVGPVVPVSEEKVIPPKQTQGRVLRLTARVGNQPNDGLRGWIGVNMEPVELPLALSVGLADANGALILGVSAGGPAAQAGLRFGDIVVGMNGRAIAGMNDLRQRVMAATPGSEAVFEVWRVGSDDDTDFIATLRRLADEGNAHVMFRLGKFYAFGNGVAKDDVTAVQWYRKGADAGNASAMTALALALLEGRGTAINQQEALRRLKDGANAGNTDAMNRLGHILLEGTITDKDALEAARLFKKAAEAEHVPSMVDLARLYYNGVGIQADLGMAAVWYKRAADLGNSVGMVALGWMHEHGKGVDTDPVRAAELYRRAADLGNSAGMVDLALLYVQGKGVPKNEVAAVSLYRKAIGLGNAMAMNNLAWMLQAGRGVDRKDPEEAAELMMKALDRKNEFSRQRMTQYSNSWTREFRVALQRRLQQAGVYNGRVDGNFRESTISAINDYFNRPR
jgi:TPR repeat protein